MTTRYFTKNGHTYGAYGPSRLRPDTIALTQADGTVIIEKPIAEFDAAVAALGYQPEADATKLIRVNATKLAALIAAIQSPAYAYSRTITAGMGGSSVTFIYHRDARSPSGVMRAEDFDSAIVDPLIRALRNNSPLSPTEGLNKSGVTCEPA